VLFRSLRTEMERALVSTTAPRTIVARIERVEPKVTEDSVGEKYPVVVTVDRGGFRLRLFKRLELVKTYPSTELFEQIQGLGQSG
jgi:hypothetical protein